ncbi:MAG: hypothetical protein KKI14_03955, partial [Nanoarchaeota archaeon]|nr:hypothetical protein [Nanoarchaeota archaeon]
MADGSDAHKVNIYINAENADGTVTPITKADLTSVPPKYRVRALLKWEDTLKREQAVTENEFGALTYNPVADALKYQNKPFKNAANGGALYKPVVLYTTGTQPLDGEVGIPLTPASKYQESLTSLTWATPPTSGQIIRDIKSVAPTSNENTSKTEKGKIINNEDFTLINETLGEPLFAGQGGLGADFKLEPNALRLKSVEWRIEKLTAGVVVDQYSGGYYPPGNGSPVSLRYKPALSVPTLLGPNGTDTLWLYRNVLGTLGVKGADARTYGGAIPINPNDPFMTTIVKIYLKESNEGLFETKFKLEPMDPSIGLNKITKLFSSLQQIFQPQLKATLSTNAESLPSNYAKSSAIYTVISYKPYGGVDVGLNEDKYATYFSNHLPRIQSAMTNQAVVILGTTLSQGANIQSVQEGVNITG